MLGGGRGWGDLADLRYLINFRSPLLGIWLVQLVYKIIVNKLLFKTESHDDFKDFCSLGLSIRKEILPNGQMVYTYLPFPLKYYVCISNFVFPFRNVYLCVWIDTWMHGTQYQRHTSLGYRENTVKAETFNLITNSMICLQASLK